MHVEGGYLVANDGSVKVALTPDDLIEKLRTKSLVPNLFLVFAYLTYWCGIKPLVGHGSSLYLSKMKEAWLDVLKIMPEEAARVASIDTKGLIGGSVVAYKRENSQIKS